MSIIECSIASSWDQDQSLLWKPQQIFSSGVVHKTFRFSRLSSRFTAPRLVHDAPRYQELLRESHAVYETSHMRTMWSSADLQSERCTCGHTICIGNVQYIEMRRPADGAKNEQGELRLETGTANQCHTFSGHASLAKSQENYLCESIVSQNNALIAGARYKSSASFKAVWKQCVVHWRDGCCACF